MAAVLGNVLHTMCITDLFLENPDPVHEEFQSQGTQINNCRCMIIYIRDQKSPSVSGSAQIPVLLSSRRALPNLPGTDPSPAAFKHLGSLPQESDGQWPGSFLKRQCVPLNRKCKREMRKSGWNSSLYPKGLTPSAHVNFQDSPWQWQAAWGL